MTKEYIGIYLNCPQCTSKNITNDPTWGIDLLIGICKDCGHVFYNGKPNLTNIKDFINKR